MRQTRGRSLTRGPAPLRIALVECFCVFIEGLPAWYCGSTPTVLKRWLVILGLALRAVSKGGVDPIVWTTSATGSLRCTLTKGRLCKYSPIFQACGAIT
ncbi:hypothetical protein SBV1_500009 [Verrucomicrobia bacterium]|nr:hypothetical protein SBV1_500009 [Verrucomicrobiota bacterium]